MTESVPLDIIETTYRNMTIQMIETKNDVYTVNILDQQRNCVYSMANILHWEEADMWAWGFIDGYLLRTKKTI